MPLANTFPIYLKCNKWNSIIKRGITLLALSIIRISKIHKLLIDFWNKGIWLHNSILSAFFRLIFSCGDFPSSLTRLVLFVVSLNWYSVQWTPNEWDCVAWHKDKYKFLLKIYYKISACIETYRCYTVGRESVCEQWAMRQSHMVVSFGVCCVKDISLVYHRLELFCCRHAYAQPDAHLIRAKGRMYAALMQQTRCACIRQTTTVRIAENGNAKDSNSHSLAEISRAQMWWQSVRVAIKDLVELNSGLFCL